MNVVTTNRDVRKEFIQQKYVQKKFISKSGHSPAVLLEVIDCAIIKGDAGLIVNWNIWEGQAHIYLQLLFPMVHASMETTQQAWTSGINPASINIVTVESEDLSVFIGKSVKTKSMVKFSCIHCALAISYLPLWIHTEHYSLVYC